MESIRSRYEEIFDKCARTPGGFIHAPDPRSFFDVPAEERMAFWEHLYSTPGFEKWVGNFREVLMDENANAEFTEGLEKINEFVTCLPALDSCYVFDFCFDNHHGLVYFV